MIVKEISGEDLKQLQKLSFETAIIVLNGEIVLFTTGNESEIGTSGPVSELLNKAAFISHVHSEGTKQEGPSSFDLHEAVAAPGVEYVITSGGTYAYNENGIQNSGQTWSLEETAKLIGAAREAARKNSGEEQTAARSELNQFIREMDIYNQTSQENRETFRRSLIPVATLEDLQNMQNDLAGDYYLTANIDAGGVNWLPIGAEFNGRPASPFRGSFNGNGFTISNLTIDRAGDDNVGLFRSLESSGTIENIKLENVSIRGGSNVGALTGYMALSEVNNISVENGTVTGLNRVGGLVGESYNGLGINNSRSNVIVNGLDEVAGIVGKIWDGYLNNINQSYALGAVSGRNKVGGIAGYSKSGDIVRSYAFGNVTGQNFVGGLAGYTVENAGIRNSYYSGGTVTGTTANVGGIAGYYDSYDDGVSNTYFAGNVTSAGGAGGFIGTYSARSVSHNYISNNFWDTTLNPGLQDASSGDLTQITGRGTAEMKTQSNFTGWDFNSVWTLNPNDYPRLQQAIAVSTLKELKDVKNNLNAKYYLANDIDASDTANWNGGAGFEPIGTRGNAFRGSFNGNGYKIVNLTINRPNQDYVGFFGSLENSGTIENIKLENISILGRDNVGAVTGYMVLASFTNASADGGIVTGRDRVGGLVGESYNGLGINNSHSNVTVQGNNQIGGIVGKLWDGNGNDLNRTYSLGAVTGVSNVGGLAGYDKSGDFNFSYATGNVTGDNFVGGLAGSTTENAGIHNSYYAVGQVSGKSNTVGGIAGAYDSYDDGVSNSYFAGKVTSTGTAGGFFGTYTARSVSPNYILSNYWDAALNPGLQDTSAGGLAEISDRTTAQMKTRSNYTGWDFNTVWFMDGYPRFKTEDDPIFAGSVNIPGQKNGYVTIPYTTVNFEGPEGTVQMRYGLVNGNVPVNGSTPGALGAWGNYQTSVNSVPVFPANVPGGQDGQKTFYAQYRDAAGNESTIVSFLFSVDTTPPAGLVKIADGSSDTNTQDNEIFLNASDLVSGVEEMRISSDGGAIWTLWEPVSSSAQVHFPRGAGDKTVLVELRDRAGNKTQISDVIKLETDLLTDIAAGADTALSTPVQGDVSGTRIGDRYVITGTNHVESSTSFTFPQGIDMKGADLAFRYNVLQGAGDAVLLLKEKLPDGSYVIRESFSPIKLSNAGSGENEIIFPVAGTLLLSKVTDVVLVINNGSGNFNLEITDFDLRDAGYEEPSVSNGDILTNSSSIYTMLNVNGQPSHNGEFFPANWGLTENGAYHFDGVQQGGTETEFFQNLDRRLDMSGKTLRIAYESSTGAAGSKIKLRNAQGTVYELSFTVSFEATAAGTQKILEIQVPSDVKWQEIDQITLSTYGQGAIDLTLNEMRIVNASSQPVLTDPLSLIISGDPGKIFLSPEIFVSLDPDKTIVNVLRSGQNRIIRIDTKDDAFAYYYDAQGNLIKTIQAALDDEEVIREEYEYLYNYEAAQNNTVRLKDIEEYRYETERINAALGVTPVTSSSLKPDPNAPQSPFPSSYATDGSGGEAGRPWIAALDDADPTLTLDLGKFTNIDEIQVDARFFGNVTDLIYPTDFILSGSLDGVHWFDLAQYDSPEYQGGTNKVYKYEMDITQVRYVRARDIQAVIPYWVDASGNYPELSGFPVTAINAYLSELRVIENRQKTVLTDIYRAEYGCLYGCETSAGNPVAKIKKASVSGSGEIAAPVVTLVSSPYTQNGTYFLDFLADGQSVKRQVSGPITEGNNLRVFSFINEDGALTLVPVNVIKDSIMPAGTIQLITVGNRSLGQSYNEARIQLTGITETGSGLKEIRYRVGGGAWTALLPLPAGQTFTADVTLPEYWGTKNLEIQIEDKAANIRDLNQNITIAVEEYLKDVEMRYLSPSTIDAASGYQQEGFYQQGYTQPSHIGFYAQLLANVIAGEIVTDKLTAADARIKLQTVINSLKTDQLQWGKFGLLPWLEFDGTARRPATGDYGHQVTFIDNSNLSASLGAVSGALRSLASQSDINQIITDIEIFLDRQNDGYQKLYDSTKGLFRNGCLIDNASTCTTMGGYQDVVGNEARSGVEFVMLRYNISENSFLKMLVHFKSYIKADGTGIGVAVPYDGGAFQMLWSLLTMPETLNSGLSDMLSDYVDAALDYSERNNLVGLASAGWEICSPGDGNEDCDDRQNETNGFLGTKYNRYLGIPSLAGGSATYNGQVGSLYTLGAAYILNPARVKARLEAIMTQYESSLVTSHGLWEGYDNEQHFVVQEQVGANAFTFILGLIGHGADHMTSYLKWKDSTAPAGNPGYYSRLKTFFTNDAVNILTQSNQLCVERNGVWGDCFSSWPKPYPVNISNYSNFKVFFKRNTPAPVFDSGGEKLTLKYKSNLDISNLTIEFKTGATSPSITIPNVKLKASVGTSTSEISFGLPPNVVFNNIREITLLASGGAGNQTLAFSVEGFDLSGSSFPGGKSAAGPEVPTASIEINEGDGYTLSRDVTLKLDASKNVSQMRLSLNDGDDWLPWEDFQEERAVTLSEGAGLKKIRVQVKSEDGQYSDLYSDEIVYDVPGYLAQTQPEPSVVPVVRQILKQMLLAVQGRISDLNARIKKAKTKAEIKLLEKQLADWSKMQDQLSRLDEDMMDEEARIIKTGAVNVTVLSRVMSQTASFFEVLY